MLTILLIATEWMISGFDPRFTNVLWFMSVPLFLIANGFIERYHQWYSMFDHSNLYLKTRVIDSVFSFISAGVLFILLNQVTSISMVHYMISFTILYGVQLLIKMKFDKNASSQLKFIFFYSMLLFFVNTILRTLMKS